MGNGVKIESQRADALSVCKNPSCRKQFKKKRKDQVYCNKKCSTSLYKEATKKGLAIILGYKKSHYSNIEGIKQVVRLQRMLKFFEQGGSYTTLSLQAKKFVAISTMVWELNCNFKRTNLPKEFKKYKGYQILREVKKSKGEIIKRGHYYLVNSKGKRL